MQCRGSLLAAKKVDIDSESFKADLSRILIGNDLVIKTGRLNVVEIARRGEADQLGAAQRIQLMRRCQGGLGRSTGENYRTWSRAIDEVGRPPAGGVERSKQR